MKYLVLLSFLLFALESPAQTVSADTLKQYVGAYTMKGDVPFETFNVTVKDGYLYGEADSNGANKLIKQKDKDNFLSTSTYGSTIIFVRNDAQKVIGLQLIVQGNTLSAEKKE